MSNTESYTGVTPDVTDAPFAATPVWDRPRKRRGLTSRSPARAAPAADDTNIAPAIGAGFGLGVGPVLAETDAARPPQTSADAVMRRRQAAGRSAPKGLIAAGAIALAAAGGAGWYFTHDSARMPAITPSTLQVAEVAAPAPMPLAPEVAPAPPIPNANPREAVNPPPMARAVRAQASAKRAQMAARSAAASAADASAAAALPDAPQTYAASQGASAPPSLAVTPPPAADPAPELVSPPAAPQVTPE